MQQKVKVTKQEWKIKLKRKKRMIKGQGNKGKKEKEEKRKVRILKQVTNVKNVKKKGNEKQ